MIAHELIGPEYGPRVVLTHGAFVDRSEFAAQLERLRRRYRVLLWDLPEHGMSPGRFTYEGAVDALVGLLDGLGWERSILVGHSLGGNISQSVVLRAPHRVAGLFAFDCTSNTLPLMPYEYGFMGIAPWYVGSMPYDVVLAQTVHGGAASARGRAYLRDAMARVPQERYIRIVSEALRAIAPLPWYRTPVPLQIVVGREDLVACIAQTAPRWAARELNARFDVVEGAGHLSNIDAPERFNALLERFLNDVA